MKSFEHPAEPKASGYTADFHPVDLVPEVVFRVENVVRGIFERRQVKRAEKLNQAYTKLQVELGLCIQARSTGFKLADGSRSHKVSLVCQEDNPESVLAVKTTPINLDDDKSAIIDVRGEMPVFEEGGKELLLGFK